MAFTLYPPPFGITSYILKKTIHFIFLQAAMAAFIVNVYFITMFLISGNLNGLCLYIPY